MKSQVQLTACDCSNYGYAITVNEFTFNILVFILGASYYIQQFKKDIALKGTRNELLASLELVSFTSDMQVHF